MKTRNLILITILAIFAISLQANTVSANCQATAMVTGAIVIEPDDDANTIKVGFTATGADAQALISIIDDGEGCAEAQVSGSSDEVALVQVQNVQDVIFGAPITLATGTFSGLTAGTDLLYAVDDYTNFQASDVNAGNDIISQVGGNSVTAGATVQRNLQAGHDLTSFIGSSSLATNNIEVDANNFNAGRITFVVENPVGNVVLSDFNANSAAFSDSITAIVDNAGPASNVNANNFNGVNDVQAVVIGGASSAFNNVVSQQGRIAHVVINSGAVTADNFDAYMDNDFYYETITSSATSNFRSRTGRLSAVANQVSGSVSAIGLHGNQGSVSAWTGIGGSADMQDITADQGVVAFFMDNIAGPVNVQNINGNSPYDLDVQFEIVGAQSDVTLAGPLDGSFAGAQINYLGTLGTIIAGSIKDNDFILVNIADAITPTITKNGASAVLSVPGQEGFLMVGADSLSTNDLLITPFTPGITATATSGAAGSDQTFALSVKQAAQSGNTVSDLSFAPVNSRIIDSATNTVTLTAAGLEELITPAPFADVVIDGVSQPQSNALLLSPLGRRIIFDGETSSCPPTQLTAADDSIGKLFLTSASSGRTTCTNRRFVTGSLLEIFEPAEITASSTELPFVYSTGDNYWDVSTSITPPDGCTVDKTTQSTTVDHSTEALVFTLNCGSSSATGAAITGAVAGGNGGASGKHVVKDCTSGKGCRVTNLNINIPDAAQASAAAPAKSRAPPLSGAAVNGGQSVDPIFLVGVLAIVALIALVAFGARKK